MNEKRELIKNTLIISIGKFSTRIVSFILLPLYTALLSTSEYGTYDLLNTISIFMIPLITLQLEEAMFRFLIDAKGKSEKGKIFTQTIFYAFVSYFIWAILILLFSLIFHFEYGPWLIAYLFGSVLFIIATSLARGEENIKLYSLLSFINSTLNIILNVLFIAVFKLGLPGLFLAYIISCIIIGLYGIIKLKGHKYFNLKLLDKKTMKTMVKFALPLVPNTISWQAISLSNRLIITNILNIGMNGIYSVANRFPTIINTCYGFFNVSWRESASKMVNKEDRDEFYNSVYLNLTRFLISTSIVVVAVLPFAFPILVNKSYNDAYMYIPFMILSTYYANMSNFSSGIFAAYKDNNILAPTTIVAAFINLVIGILFTSKIGLFAPIIGTFIAYFLINIYRNYKLRKYIVLAKDKYKYLSLAVYGLVTLLYFSKNILLYILGLIISIWYFTYLNKGLINEFLNKKNFKFLKKFKLFRKG